MSGVSTENKKQEQRNSVTLDDSEMKYEKDRETRTFWDVIHVDNMSIFLGYLSLGKLQICCKYINVTVNYAYTTSDETSHTCKYVQIIHMQYD